jgi:1-acyl-sn-glycerol-3-phosphate acyltransferase
MNIALLENKIKELKMIYFYLVLSAALIPILNNFFDILKQSYSWWLVPVLFIGFLLAFIIIQAAILLISIFTVNINKPITKNQRFFRFILKHSLPIILFFVRVKINISGLEKLPKDTRVLFVCNHQHDFDCAVMLSVFPDSDIAFIGKKEIYETMPFIAKAMHKLNSLPIDREHDREAAKTVIKAIKTIKDDIASIALFPEGYVSPTCELLPIRNGSLKIATKSEVPIVVCVLNNTRSIPKNMFIRKTEVEFKLLDVITPEDYKELNTTQIGDIIHEKMETALKEIRG